MRWNELCLKREYYFLDLQQFVEFQLRLFHFKHKQRQEQRQHVIYYWPEVNRLLRQTLPVTISGFAASISCPSSPGKLGGLLTLQELSNVSILENVKLQNSIEYRGKSIKNN